MIRRLRAENGREESSPSARVARRSASASKLFCSRRRVVFDEFLRRFRSLRINLGVPQIECALRDEHGRALHDERGTFLFRLGKTKSEERRTFRFLFFCDSLEKRTEMY